MIAGRPCSAPIVFAIADRAAAPTLPVRRALASHGTFDVDRRKLLAEDSVAIPLSMGGILPLRGDRWSAELLDVHR